MPANSSSRSISGMTRRHIVWTSFSSTFSVITSCRTWTGTLGLRCAAMLAEHCNARSIRGGYGTGHTPSASRQDRLRALLLGPLGILPARRISLGRRAGSILG